MVMLSSDRCGVEAGHRLSAVKMSQPSAAGSGAPRGRSTTPSRTQDARGRSRETNQQGRPGGASSQSRSPTRFSEGDFDRKRESIDPEMRKKQAMKAKGLKLEPKDWTKAELLNKLTSFARFSQDKQTSVAELQFIENSTLTGEEIKIVDELFHRVTEIQSITLHRCNLTDEMLSKLLENSFKQLRFVRVLSLCHNTLTYQSVDTLIGVFAPRRRFPLETLDLRGNAMKFEDGYKLAKNMSYVRSLNGIEVSDMLQEKVSFGLLSSSDSDEDGKESESKSKAPSRGRARNKSADEDDDLPFGNAIRKGKHSRRGSPNKKASKQHEKEREELMDDPQIQQMEAKAFAIWSTAKSRMTKFTRCAQYSMTNATVVNNPYVSTPKNSLLLSNREIRVMEVGIVVFLLESLRKTIRHVDLSGNQINTQAFHYLLDYIIRNEHDSNINTLNLADNPLTSNGVNIDVMETLLHFIQSNTKLTSVNLDRVVMPESLRVSIQLSVAANRSVVYSQQNATRFNEFLQRSIHMYAKPTPIPELYHHAWCRYDYDPQMFLKGEVGTLGGEDGLLAVPAAVTTIMSNNVLSTTGPNGKPRGSVSNANTPTAARAQSRTPTNRTSSRKPGPSSAKPSHEEIDLATANIASSHVQPMRKEDFTKGLYSEPDEDFFFHNQLPVCDVVCDNRGFHLQWKNFKHQTASDDQLVDDLTARMKALAR